MITLRKTDDLDLIQELDRVVFPNDGGMDDEDLHESIWWLCRFEKEPVGFCGLRVNPERTEGFMSRVGVLKAARGGGLQRRMIHLRMREARALELTRVFTYTWVGNIPSMKSLTHCGFFPYKQEWDYGLSQSFLYWEKSTCRRKPARRRSQVPPLEISSFEAGTSSAPTVRSSASGEIVMSSGSSVAG